MKTTGKASMEMDPKALIAALTKAVDWRFVVEKLRERYNISVQDGVDHVKSQIITYGEKPVCRLDFDVKVRLSMLCDRSGRCLKIFNPGADGTGEPQEEDREPASVMDPARESIRREQAQLARGLAEMMEEINRQ